MCRPYLFQKTVQKTLQKKQRVYAIGSMLALWITTTSPIAQEEKSWPPNAKKIVAGGETSVVPGVGITLQDVCKGGSAGPCNVIMHGGTLVNNKGTTVAITTKGPETSIMVDAGLASIENAGTITVAEGATGVRIKKGNLSIRGPGTVDASKARAAIDATGVKTNLTVILGGGRLLGRVMGGGKITDNLSIESNQVVQGSISAFANIAIHTGDDLWTLDGWISGAHNVSVEKDIADLYVSGAKYSPDKPQRAKTLHLHTESAVSVASGVVNKLHLQGGAKLSFDFGGRSANTNVTNTFIDAKTNWSLDGWITQPKTLTVSSNIAHLFVNDKTARNTPSADNTLHMAATTPLTLLTAEKTASIAHLHISGAPQLVSLKNRQVNVTDIEVNSARDWNISIPLTGVRSITANRPTVPEPGKSTVIKAIDVAGVKSAPATGHQTLTIDTATAAVAVSAVESGLIKALNVGEGARCRAVTNVDDINIAPNSTHWQLGVVTDASAINASTHEFDTINVGKGLSSSASGRNLVLNTLTRAVSISAKRIDTLELEQGALLGAVGAVNHLRITGNGGTATQPVTMTGEASIHIGKAVRVTGISTVAAHSGAIPLLIDFTPVTAALSITNAGIVQGDINFATFKGRVTLQQSGGAVNGNLYGVSRALFSGISQFNGSFDSAVSLVKISGQLTTKGSAALQLKRSSVGAKLHITAGARLMTNRAIIVDGTYQQEGDLEVETGTSTPLISANAIKIGPNAGLIFKTATPGDVLMESATAINRRVNLTVNNSSYEYVSAEFDGEDKKRLIVASQPLSAHLAALGREGGASASEISVLQTAASPKTGQPGRVDPLRDFVFDHAKTAATAYQVARQLLPDNTGSVVGATRQAQQMVFKAIDNRATSGINSGDRVDAGNFWLQYGHNDATQDEQDGVFGYKAKTGGFTLAAAGAVNEMTDVGLAYTYGKGDISGRKGTLESENNVFTLYGSFWRDSLYLNGQLGYTRGRNDARRFVGDDSFKADYHSQSWNFGVSGGYTVPINRHWYWQPWGAFDYHRIAIDDYREQAANPAYNFLAYDRVENKNYSIVELGAGVKLLGHIQTGALTLRPAFKLMAFHDFNNDPVTMIAHFEGVNAFVVQGAKREVNRYQWVATLDLNPAQNLTLSLNYSHDWSRSFKAKGVVGRLRYLF